MIWYILWTWDHTWKERIIHWLIERIWHQMDYIIREKEQKLLQKLLCMKPTKCLQKCVTNMPQNLSIWKPSAKNHGQLYQNQVCNQELDQQHIQANSSVQLLSQTEWKLQRHFLVINRQQSKMKSRIAVTNIRKDPSDLISSIPSSWLHVEWEKHQTSQPSRKHMWGKHQTSQPSRKHILVRDPLWMFTNFKFQPATDMMHSMLKKFLASKPWHKWHWISLPLRRNQTQRESHWNWTGNRKWQN